MRKPKLKDKTLRLRLTEHEHFKIIEFASTKGISVSQLLRQYIHRLPNPVNSLKIQGRSE